MTATIDDKLQDLIAKSDVIVKLLEGQLAMLEEQKVKVEDNLTVTLDDREFTVGELEALRSEIQAHGPADHHAGKQDRQRTGRRCADQAGNRAGRAEHQYNAKVQDEQVKLAKSQTLERYIEKGKTWVDSACRTRRRRRWC